MTAPTWKYRWFRLRWVDHTNSWLLGVAFDPRERFSANGAEFRALCIQVGRREYVFDLGKRP